VRCGLDFEVRDCHGRSWLDSCGVLSWSAVYHVNCEGAKGALYAEVLF
jgi:hypothetical protein